MNTSLHFSRLNVREYNCLELHWRSVFSFIFLFFFNVYFYFWDRERQSMNGGGSEREGDTESEIGSRLWVVSTEPNAGLELTDRETMTWAEVGRLTDWATQAPLNNVCFNWSSRWFWCRLMSENHYTLLPKGAKSLEGLKYHSLGKGEQETKGKEN